MFRIFSALMLCTAVCWMPVASEAATKKAPVKKVAVKKVPAAVKKLCPSIIAVTSGGLIYKNSAPIRSGGVGTPLIGYREEPTLIMQNNVSSRGWTTIYDSKGKSIGRCPWASAEHTYGGRYRCVMNTRSLRRSAVKNTKSPLIYIRLTAKKCVSVPDAGKCYGSVKGKCNQTLT